MKTCTLLISILFWAFEASAISCVKRQPPSLEEFQQKYKNSQIQFFGVVTGIWEKEIEERLLNSTNFYNTVDKVHDLTIYEARVIVSDIVKGAPNKIENIELINACDGHLPMLTKIFFVWDFDKDENRGYFQTLVIDQDR